MSDPFVGEIRPFGFSFAPVGWAVCAGQLMPISQNTALFSILGTQYGGDGRTNFALPDLRGVVPLHAGQGPGLSLRSIGGTGGTETVVLATAQLPLHTHTAACNDGAGTSYVPTGGVWAKDAGGANEYSPAGAAALAAAALAAAGSNAAHDNMQPFLAINYCIALNGVYPSRS